MYGASGPGIAGREVQGVAMPLPIGPGTQVVAESRPENSGAPGAGGRPEGGPGGGDDTTSPECDTRQLLRSRDSRTTRPLSAHAIKT